MAHGHSHGAPAVSSSDRARKKLIYATALCLFFMIAEIVGGILSGSLSIVTDAAHLLSDASGFIISLFALKLAQKPADSRASWAYHRRETYGAVASIFVVWLLTFFLVYEAILRFITPEPVDGKIMFAVAVVGLVVNLVMMAVLGGDNSHGHSHGLPTMQQMKGMCCSSGRGGHSHSARTSSASKPELVPLAAADAYLSMGDTASSEGSSSRSSSAAHGHSHSHSRAAAAEEEHHCDGGGHGHGHSGEGEGEHHGHSHGGHGQGEDGHEEDENLNVRAAFIHVLGDLIQSLGVLIASIIIWAKPELHVVDPVVTLLFSVLVLLTTRPIMAEAMRTLLNSVPSHINLAKVAEELQALPGVANVHDLHIWR